MTKEYLATIFIALLYAVRMFGLFMVLPTFALVAKQYSLSLVDVGLVLGSYGLTQALCQIPMGMLSDKFGRKNILFFGYILFTAGSFIAFGLESFWGLLLGRILQGSGAVGGVLLALISDVTAEQKKSLMMAVVGGFIGASFIIALPMGSWIGSDLGVQYIFLINAISGVCACILVLFLPSAAAANIYHQPQRNLLKVSIFNQFNFGIMITHTIQMMLWVSIPVMLWKQFSIAEYYSALIWIAGGAFALMIPLLKMANRSPKKGLLIALVMMIISLVCLASITHLTAFTVAVLIFFIAFSFFEVRLPALASSQCNFMERGMRMGIFSSWQFMGIFIGSWLGSYLVEHQHLDKIFILASILVIAWSVIVLRSTICQYESIRVEPSENIDFQSLRKIQGVYDVVFIESYKAYYVKVSKGFDKSQLI